MPLLLRAIRKVLEISITSIPGIGADRLTNVNSLSDPLKDFTSQIRRDPSHPVIISATDVT